MGRPRIAHAPHALYLISPQVSSGVRPAKWMRVGTGCGAHRIPGVQMTRYLLVAAASIACTALPARVPGGGRTGGIAPAQAVPPSPATPAPSDSLKVVLLGTGSGPPVNLLQYGTSTLVEA